MLRLLLVLLAVVLAPAQEKEPAPEKPVEFTCPMDPDVRTQGPGKCPRCGMRLAANLPEPVEYPMRVRTRPRAPRAGEKVVLEFAVSHPKTGRPVSRYEVVHEKLFHAFLVSRDLTWFAHEHPAQGTDSVFRLETKLPVAGAYRVAADFFPTGGTPQLVVKTLFTAGATAAQMFAVPKLAADPTPRRGENIEVELVTEPPQPLAGKETLMFFRVKPAEGLERYLGAWGHLLAASDDLVDLMHHHPRFPEPGPQIQFNVLFPREAVYRAWVQFQRNGVVNTVAFNVPVKALR